MGDDMRESAVLHRVKQGYTTGARSLASRSIVGLARTRVTPNALTTSGVSLCLAAAVLVFFEDRNDLLLGLGLRGDVGLGSRAERVVVITAGLVLAPWGALQWAIYLLTATAWLTVLQRILFVRKQLLARK